MSQQPFGDIPLFREIQRLLASSGGPINLEIARQIAGTLATQTPDPAPSPQAAREFEEAVRRSEDLLTGYSRLSLDEPLQTATIGKATWVLTTLEGWRWILERLAQRFVEQMSEMGGEGEEADPMRQAFGQLGPLLSGIQAGQLIGTLATDALGRYDLPIPREDENKLLFVAPNIDRLAQEYTFEPSAFRQWLALHECARHTVLTAVPWTTSYFKSLLVEIVDSLEIDVAGLERRIIEIRESGVEGLESMGGQEIPIAPTERHQTALSNLRAFLATYEGYARHAAGEVADVLIGVTDQMDEGMARRAVSPNEGLAMLGRVLGVEPDRALESAGTTFAAAVTKLKGIAALNRLWEAPDNLPNLGEIKDPFAWMERVLGEDS